MGGGPRRVHDSRIVGLDGSGAEGVVRNKCAPSGRAVPTPTFSERVGTSSVLFRSAARTASALRARFRSNASSRWTGVRSVKGAAVSMTGMLGSRMVGRNPTVPDRRLAWVLGFFGYSLPPSVAA